MLRRPVKPLYKAACRRGVNKACASSTAVRQWVQQHHTQRVPVGASASHTTRAGQWGQQHHTLHHTQRVPASGGSSITPCITPNACRPVGEAASHPASHPTRAGQWGQQHHTQHHTQRAGHPPSLLTTMPKSFCCWSCLRRGLRVCKSAQSNR